MQRLFLTDSLPLHMLPTAALCLTVALLSDAMPIAPQQGSGSTRPMVKKRAALCLLRMVRKSPVDTQVVNPDTFCSCLNALLEERDIGLLLSCVTLLGGIVARSGIGARDGLVT